MRFVDMLKNDGFTDNRITVIEHEGLTATSFGITWAKNERGVETDGKALVV